jgi:hypothetical protein
MKLTVHLRGYPEAVLAADTISLDLPPVATAGAVARSLSGHSERLAAALLREDGSPRQTTKVLINGLPVSHDVSISSRDTVTLLASLPCDG